jgi:hypothetical protein
MDGAALDWTWEESGTGVRVTDIEITGTEKMAVLE